MTYEPLKFDMDDLKNRTADNRENCSLLRYADAAITLGMCKGEACALIDHLATDFNAEDIEDMIKHYRKQGFGVIPSENQTLIHWMRSYDDLFRPKED